MEPQNTLKGTPWDDEPATEVELAEIKKQIGKEDSVPISKEMEEQLKSITSHNRSFYNYGDEDQNDIMHEIDSDVHEEL